MLVVHTKKGDKSFHDYGCWMVLVVAVGICSRRCLIECHTHHHRKDAKFDRKHKGN
ncbi:hypothetical protein IC582_000859 [Cucumis melo]